MISHYHGPKLGLLKMTLLESGLAGHRQGVVQQEVGRRGPGGVRGRAEAPRGRRAPPIPIVLRAVAPSLSTGWWRRGNACAPSPSGRPRRRPRRLPATRCRGKRNGERTSGAGDCAGKRKCVVQRHKALRLVFQLTRRHAHMFTYLDLHNPYYGGDIQATRERRCLPASTGRASRPKPRCWW